MKGLFWKEWRENRGIVIISFALMAVLTALMIEFAIRTSSSPAQYKVREEDLSILLTFFWSIPAALCGVSIVAPEVSSGTLQLLTSLPISRSKVWWIKIAASLLVLVLADIAAYAAYGVMYESFSVFSVMAEPLGLDLSSISSSLLTCVVLSLPVFAISTAASTLVENTITALVVVVISALALVSATMFALMLVQVYGYLEIAKIIVVLELVIVVLMCFILSHQVFVHGETLKTMKRFTLLLNSKAVDILTVLTAIAISYAWLVN